MLGHVLERQILMLWCEKTLGGWVHCPGPGVYGCMLTKAQNREPKATFPKP